MPNILLTNYCNRACPYCFAKEKVGSQRGSSQERKNLNISLENVDYIIQFLKKSGHFHFSLLGGEPTLHPQFTEIVDRGLENNLMIRVFTNGLISRKKQQYIFRKNIDMILNMNSPDITPKAHLRRLEGLYDNLGPNIYPGFNIYREDFDFSFIFDLIDKYYMPRQIRLGISQPIVNEANEFIAPRQYRKIGRKLMALAAEAGRRDIKLNFDCGFVLCMFSKRDVGNLVYANTDLRFECGPTIDIDPELNVWSCFPLSNIWVRNLREFKDLKAAVHFYGQLKTKFSGMGMLPKCRTCVFLKRQQCTGGCIAHKIKTHPQMSWELFA